MQVDVTYRRALGFSIILHVLLIGSLSLEFTAQRPVVKPDTINMAAQSLPVTPKDLSQSAIVKAVSVDNQEIAEEVKRIETARAQAKQAEINHQNALKNEAERVRRARVAEQQKLQRLKQEADKLAILKKKQMQEEQKRLKQLAEEKAKQTKALEDLKRERAQLAIQKKQEAQQLALMQKKTMQKKTEEEQARKIKAAETARQQALLDKKKAQEKAESRENARIQAEREARIAGEVDRYKALILDAIGRQWILPDHVDNNLSSVFHIRLAADGSVLEVRLVRSSGDPILDRSASRAIYKASPLPVPRDSMVFNVFRDINLTVRPENVSGTV